MLEINKHMKQSPRSSQAANDLRALENIVESVSTYIPTPQKLRGRVAGVLNEKWLKGFKNSATYAKRVFSSGAHEELNSVYIEFESVDGYVFYINYRPEDDEFIELYYAKPEQADNKYRELHRDDFMDYQYYELVMQDLDDYAEYAGIGGEQNTEPLLDVDADRADI